MSYQSFQNAIGRTVTWLFELKLDYCENVCGQSPCQASGPPYCYYTYATCQDPDHFTKGTKTYRFSRAQGPRIADALPLVAEIQSVPTEIRPQDCITRRARVTVQLIDDAPLALANPDKAESNLETGGAFLKNLIARNPNAVGRAAEIRQGFEGLPLEEYRLVFAGVIDKLEYEEGRARVIVKDRLKLLDKQVPRRQSSGNVLIAVYNGGATMSVTDGLEFEAPGVAKVESEYVVFTGVAGDELTGCAPGKFGTAAASHAVGKAVVQVLPFAEPDDGAGVPPDEAFLRLICEQGGIDPLAIATVDRGATLTEAVSDVALVLSVGPVSAFPETGVVRIDDELVRYRGVADGALMAVERGAYGTVAAGHAAAAPVLVTRFSDELGRWWAGSGFKRRVEKNVALKTLVNELREQCLLHVWQAEDSTIAAKCMAPCFFADPPAELDDATGFIDDSTGWDPGDELRLTRVLVHYAPNVPDPSADAADWDGLLVLVDAEAESADFYGEPREKEIRAAWIFREHEALLLASRLLVRFRSGAGTFKFAVELKDGGLGVGDFVRVTSNEVVDPSGAVRERALFEVVKKQQSSDNRIEFVAIDTRLDRRYPVIASAAIDEDYDDASREDHERYGWIGDAANRVGSESEDGYYIY